MTQNNKTIKKTRQTLKTAGNKKATRKLFVLSRLKPKNKKIVIKTAIITVVVIAIAGAIPLPHTFAKSVAVPFATENKKFVGLELGNSKVLQKGHEGRKTVNVESLQSIWGKLFGWQPIMQKEVSTTVTKQKVDKIVANGTRKYQYMMCSDGSYRYYTDEQFKDENTGFTSKSKDYCKENNQGVKLKLADSRDGTVNNSAAPSIYSETPVPSGCKKSSVPHGTEYLDASYLPRGTRQVASQGMDGFILSCPGQEDVKSSGVNQLVLIGTGKTDAEIQAEKDAEEARKQQEQWEKQEERRRNVQSCINQLVAQGRQPDSARSWCERQSF